jgi:hypothetical protein
MFSLKNNSIKIGTKFNTPKPTLDFVNELVKKASKGDECSAVTLYQISKMDAPSYTAPVAASTTIGAGDNGLITITANTAWLLGNNLTIEVVIDEGANASLAAELDGNDILVTLGTTASPGVPDNAKNTATLITAAINGITGKTFTAVASGSGATPLATTVEQKNFTGGVDEIRTEEKKAYDVAVAIISSLFE